MKTYELRGHDSRYAASPVTGTMLALLAGWLTLGGGGWLADAGPLDLAWLSTEASARPAGVAVDESGGAAIAGNSDAGAIVVQYSSSGAVAWRHAFGTGSITLVQGIEAGPAGNVWVFGYENNPDPADVRNVFARKYGMDGSLSWHHVFSSQGLADYQLPVWALDSEGNLMVGGVLKVEGSTATQNDLFLLKLSPDGTELWFRRQSIPHNHFGGRPSIAVDSAGNTVLSGYGYGSGASEFITSKWDADGTLLWTAEDSSDSPNNFTTGLAVDGAGNVYVAGTTTPDRNSEVHLAKYGPNGALLWSRARKAQRFPQAVSRGIHINSDGDVVLSVQESLPSPADSDDPALNDEVLIGLSPDGVERWVTRSVNTSPSSFTLAGGFCFSAGMRSPLEGGLFVEVRVFSGEGDQLAALTLGDRSLLDLVADSAGTLFVLGSGPDGLELRKLIPGRFDGLPTARITPREADIAWGSGFTFESQVSGPGPVFYQWYRFGNILAGETQADLNLAKPDLTHGGSIAGSYSLRVSNVNGVTLSPEALLREHATPNFGSRSQTNHLSVGRPLLWAPFVSGETPIWYQWRRNDVDLAGETNLLLALPAVTLAQAGRYTLMVSNVWGSATSDPFELSVVPASPLDDWRWRYPLPQGDDLRGAAYGNGRFVAVGSRGALITSADGVTWSNHHSESFGELNDVQFADGRFVAVGSPGRILTSTDGLNWETRGLGGLTGLSAVAFGNGSWVVVGGAWEGTGKLYPFLTSSDGENWTQHNWTNQVGLDVTFGAGRFVAVIQGLAQIALTSTNGLAWEPIDLSAFGSSGWKRSRIEFGEGRFTIVKNADCLVSTNGFDWQAADPEGNRRFDDVAIGPNGAVGVGTLGGGTDIERSRIFNSPDSIHWTTNNLKLANNIHRVVRLPDRFLALGDDGNLLSSIEGETWNAITVASDVNLNAVAVGNGVAVAVGGEGHVFVSENGGGWNLAAAGITNELRGLVYGAGRFVAVGKGGELQVSTDGRSWFAAPRGYDLRAVIYANGQFVAVGDEGSIRTSPDGTNWITRAAPVTADIESIAFGNGNFVAVTANVGTLISPDGLTWTDHGIQSSFGRRTVAYGNGTFVTAGLFSVPAVSPDGVVWTPLVPGAVREPVMSVVFAGGLFLVSGSGGAVSTSLDGIHWVERFIPTQNELNDFAFTQSGTLIGVGNNHSILESGLIMPQIGSTALGANQLTLELQGWPGATFRLQSTKDLLEPQWKDLAGFVLPGTSTNWPETVAADHRFFRLVMP